LSILPDKASVRSKKRGLKRTDHLSRPLDISEGVKVVGDFSTLDRGSESLVGELARKAYPLSVNIGVRASQGLSGKQEARIRKGPAMSFGHGTAQRGSSSRAISLSSEGATRAWRYG